GAFVGYLDTASKMGVPEADLLLGVFFEVGLCGLRDNTEARARYTRAARAGLSKARYLLKRGSSEPSSEPPDLSTEEIIELERLMNVMADAAKTPMEGCFQK